MNPAPTLKASWRQISGHMFVFDGISGLAIGVGSWTEGKAGQGTECQQASLLPPNCGCSMASCRIADAMIPPPGWTVPWNCEPM